MIYLHDSDGNYYTAHGNFEIKNDMPYYAYHIPSTAQNYAKSLGVNLQELGMEIFQNSRIDIPWHKIDKVSFDNWSTYQTVFAAVSLGFTIPPQGWTYSMQLSLLVSPLRYGTAHTSSEVCGRTSISISTNGNYTAPVKLVYKGARYYFPFDSDLRAHTGDAIDFLRSAAKTYNGVSYCANEPTFDNGLYIGTGDIAQLTIDNYAVGTLFLKLLYSKIESLTYLDGYDIGSFEKDTDSNGVADNWTESHDSCTVTDSLDGTIYKEGSYSQKMDVSLDTASDNTQYVNLISDYLPIEANTDYYVNFQGNITANTNFSVVMKIMYYDSSYTYISAVSEIKWGTSVTTTGFEFKSMAFTTPASAAYIKIAPYLRISAGDTGNITIYWDDFKVFKANRILTSGFNLELDWANTNVKLISGANVLNASFSSALDDFLYNGKYLFVGVKWNATTTYLAAGKWDETNLTFASPVTSSGSFTLTFGTIYLGSDGSGRPLGGMIKDLIIYDYEVPDWTTAKYNLTTEPLQWNEFYITNVVSGTITYQDGKLTDQDGNDITGLVSGTPLTEGNIEMTAGLSGLWSVECDDTYLP
jgi:hypothetical protein